MTVHVIGDIIYDSFDIRKTLTNFDSLIESSIGGLSP